MPIHTDIISTVGRTPLVKLNRITRGAPATIALKAEFFRIGTIFMNQTEVLPDPLAHQGSAR